MSRCDYILSTDRRIFSNVTIRGPRHYTTDHYMVLGILLSEPMKAHQSYINGRKRYPLHPQKWSPKTKIDALSKRRLQTKSQTGYNLDSLDIQRDMVVSG
jgi:hypothetical protein